MSEAKVEEEKEAVINEAPQMEWNVARLYGWSRSLCGYCGGDRAYVLQQKQQSEGNTDSIVVKDNSSKAYGLTFSHVSTTDYQSMIDCGWRRSGRHLYKPDNWDSCCAAIPIRLETHEFQASKSQKKVWRNIQKLETKYHNPINNNNKHISIKNNEAIPKVPQIRKKARRMGKVSNNNASGAGSHSVNKNSSPNKHPATKKVMEALKKSSILKQLQQSTYDILRQHFKNDTATGDVAEQHEISKTRCQFKVRTSHFQPIIPEDSTADEQYCSAAECCGLPAAVCSAIAAAGRSKHPEINLVECCVFTTVCAAIAGRSKNTINGSALATEIAGKLEKINILENCADRCVQTVRSVRSHEKSGQINVILEISLNVVEEQLRLINLIKKSEQKSDRAAKTIENQSNNSIHLSMHSSIHQSAPAEANKILSHIMSSSPGSSVNNSVFTVRSVPSGLSGKDPDVHRLFFKYQHFVHGDENPYDSIPDIGNNHRSKIQRKVRSFTRFLCDSPLSSNAGNFDVDVDGYDTHIPYGSYHQQYRINNRLVAVGVVDVLPNCLSSVYSFYDPILSKKLQLGTLTALREIEWVRRASASRPNLKYYYLGYYIHSCGKMKYKAEFKPSKLLCPKNGQWVDFETAKLIIERDSPLRHCCALVSPSFKKIQNNGTSILTPKKPSIESMLLDITPRESQRKPDTVDVLDDDTDIRDEDIESDVNLSSLVAVRDLNAYGRKIVDPHVEEFVSIVGMDISQRCIIRV